MRNNILIILSVFGLLSIISCQSPQTRDPASEVTGNSDAPSEAPLPGKKWIGFGSEHPEKCLKMEDHRKTAPIDLRGKLGVTVVDQSIPEGKGDQHEVGVLDFKSKNSVIKRLTKNLINDAETDISHDGKKMVFTQRPELDEFNKNSEIWVMNMDGTGRTKIAGNAQVGVPAWFPDNRHVIHIEWGGKENDSRMMIVDTKTKKKRRFAPHLYNGADPEVSYDGKWVTFKMPTDEDRDFQPSIYIMPASGKGEPRRLTRGYSDHDPVFSKDGKKIYFERYYGPGDWFEASHNRHDDPRNNFWGIVEVDVDTGKEKVIAPHDPCGNHFFWMPTISPDGKYIMYTHIDVFGNERGVPWTDLWVSNIDGTNPQKVPGSDWAYFFDWGP